MTSKTTSGLPNRRGFSAHLEELILSGELAGGEKLPSERAFSERYGLSRPAVREALRDLVGRGLVEVVPGRGTYVREVGSGDAAGSLETFYRRQRVTSRDLVEARKMIECEAAALAAARRGRDDLEIMGRALTRFDGSVDVVGKTRYDVAFHLGVVRAAHNPVVETMYGSIRGMVVELMLRSLGDPNVSRAGVPYHREIFEAIREQDSGKARSAMSGHLVIAEKLYAADLDRDLRSVARREMERLFGPGTTLEELLGVAGPETGTG